MTRPTKHITLFSRIFLMLTTVSVTAFSAVMVLVMLDAFEQPVRVIVTIGGVLAVVPAVLFFWVWKLLLRPVSKLADQLDGIRPGGQLYHDYLHSGFSDTANPVEIIENRTMELIRIAEESETAVRQTEAILIQALSDSGESFCRVDSDGNFLHCDHKFASTLGYDSAENLMFATGNLFADVFVDGSQAEQLSTQLQQQGEASGHLVYLRRWQQTSLCVDLDAIAIRNHAGKLLFFQINLKDVSGLETITEDLQKAGNFQNLFSEWSNILLKEEDEASLTTEFCRLLVENGDYVLAWIGAAINDAEQSVRPVAMFGYNMGLVHGIHSSWSGNQVEDDPVSRAIISGLPVIYRNIQSLGQSDGHRAEYDERGIKSILAVPLQVDNTTGGAVVVCSGSATAFADKEVKWLVDLASSFSMGMSGLRDRKTRQRAEKEQFRAEQNYRAIFDNASEGMIQLSEDQQIINANFAAANILGFNSVEDLLLHGENIGRDLLNRQAEARPQLSSEGGASERGRQEVRWLRKDGDKAWLSVNLYPNYNSQGNVTRYDGILVDITEEREAEINLRKLSRAVEQSPVTVVITDIAGNIEYVNEKFTEASGYLREEVLGKKPSILKSGHTSDSEYTKLWRTISAGEEWQGEFHNRKKNGDMFWEAASISPIRDINGRITHYLGVKEDITEAKAADEAFRQTGAHLETILNNILEGIVSADEDGIITGFNAAAENIFGYSGDDAIGQDISMLAGDGALGDLHRRIIDSFRFELNSPYIGHIIEVSGRRKDGTIFPLEISIGVALTGDLRVFIGTYRDISERKQIERERLELGERLQNSQKLESVGQLAGGIAHDFNNILTPIVGYVELAKRNTDEDTQVYKDLLRIERSARRARELTTKILAFSRPASTEILPTNLVDIITEAVDMVQIAAGSNIEVTWSNESADSVVLGDPSQLSQIVMNLVTNAQQAIGEDQGQIHVRLSDVADHERSEQKALKYQSGRFVRLRVEDTGPGMNAETRANIFEPFFTTKSTGTGLGLATVLGVVNGLDGAVTVDSEPARGTRVDIYLPLSEVRDNAAEATADDVGLLEGSEHILFVDDEPEHTDLARRILENYGYVVTPMTDSEQALKEFKARPDRFDLVVTDQMMPRLSGHDLALAMWEIRPKLPIVAISGYSKNVSELNAQKLGYCDFLAKPFDLQALVTVVRRSLDVDN